MLTERELILANLDAFVRQRSGMDYRNYGDATSYRAEQRSITRDLHDYRALRAAVQWRDGIDAAALKEAFRAFSGRLTWNGKRMDYCTGQYFPTEYRKAACAVLSQALWDYTRDKAMPEGSRQGATEGTMLYTLGGGKGHASAGEWMRRYFQREFGRGLAGRYFN